MMTQDDATKSARRALLMIPIEHRKNWTADVWANTGWNWRLKNGPISVYPAASTKGKFWAMIASDTDESGHGCADWTPRSADYQDTPLAAVVAEVGRVRAFFAATAERGRRFEEFFRSVGS